MRPSFEVQAWRVGRLGLVLAALAAPALAVEQGPYSMDILIDGHSIDEYGANGRTYVEALAGREYSVRLKNRTSGRIAVALAVDGLNSIDAETTTVQEAAKWILAPYEEIVIDGWQTSSANARRFYFTSEKASYGAWLGKTQNLGVISAAFFRERVQPVPRARRMMEQKIRPESPAGAPQSAPAPPAELRRDSESAAGQSAPQPVLSDELAATGIGRETDHPVEWVRFDAESVPAVLLEMRYEYRNALVKLGVLPRDCDGPRDRLAQRESAHGFEPGFAPDPYRRRGCR
jgi:hypothetical protein